MLRVSGNTNNVDVDLQSLTGNSDDSGVQYGPELLAFAQALAQRDHLALEQARAKLLAVAGAAVLVDAAGVAANFQRMVRIADSVGIPVDNITTELSKSVRSELSLERFASAKNTTALSD